MKCEGVVGVAFNDALGMILSGAVQAHNRNFVLMGVQPMLSTGAALI